MHQSDAPLQQMYLKACSIRPEHSLTWQLPACQSHHMGLTLLSSITRLKNVPVAKSERAEVAGRWCSKYLGVRRIKGLWKGLQPAAGVRSRPDLCMRAHVSVTARHCYSAGYAVTAELRMAWLLTKLAADKRV